MSMQDNTQNNWKSLLEDPGNFPGETIRDKNEAWESLYQRLHKKPQRKLMAWYWAAASILIVAIGTALVFVNKAKHHPTLVTVPATLKNRLPAGTGSSLSVETKNTDKASPQSKQKTHSAVRVEKNNFTATIQPVKDNLITDSLINHLPQFITASNPVYDSANKTTVAAQPKKKLRVVHVNEMGQPAEESTVNSRFTERHGPGLRLINSGIYNPVYSSSTNNGLILTKPRNTSN